LSSAENLLITVKFKATIKTATQHGYVDMHFERTTAWKSTSRLFRVQ